MNIKLLFVLLFYWSAWVVVLAAGGSALFSDVNSTGGNITGFTSDPDIIDDGGIFGIGGGLASLGDFLLFAGFGIGLNNIPWWVQLPFTVLCTVMSILTIAFLVTIVWNG
jgi:hypothetical protein